MTRNTSRTTHVVVLTLAALVAFSGGAVAKAKYDANNAHKVDGKHAVSSGAPLAKRKGKLVATNAAGRLPNNIIAKAPDSAKVGGFTHAQMSAMNLSVQGAQVFGGASSADSVNLPATGSSGLLMSFVVPPDHVVGTSLFIDIVYLDNGVVGACSWFAAASGLEGPDSPTGADVHNGGWYVPGNDAYSGPVAVPAGDGYVQKATFRWPFLDEPGAFIQFRLQRSGDEGADTCGGISVMAAQLRY